MALIVAFPYTGVAFAHTETMKMDEPGSVRPPGVCFTLLFYSLPPPPPPLYFSFFSLLFVFYLPFSLFNKGKNPLRLSHTALLRPPARSRVGSGPFPGSFSLPGEFPLSRALCPFPSTFPLPLGRQLSVRRMGAHLGFGIIY